MTIISPIITLYLSFYLKMVELTMSRGRNGSIDKKTGFKDNIALESAAGLGAADKGNLYVFTAVGTDDIKNHGLQHYAFGNGGNH
jgi:hypothetical protein